MTGASQSNVPGSGAATAPGEESPPLDFIDIALQELEARVTQYLHQAVERLLAEIKLVDRIAHARILNSSARCDNEWLLPLPLPNGNMPGSEFPANLGALSTLSGDALFDLLVLYEVVDVNAIPHDVAFRRKLVAEHFGIRKFS